MSSNEHLYFDPGHNDVLRAAMAITEIVGGKLHPADVDPSVSVSIDSLEPGAFLTGTVWANDLVYAAGETDDPRERDIHDGLPLLWSMVTGPRRDDELARNAAHVVFLRLATSPLGWPMVLAHDFGELVSTFDSERGLREFPPGTRTDATHEHIWG